MRNDVRGWVLLALASACFSAIGCRATIKLINETNEPVTIQSDNEFTEELLGEENLVGPGECLTFVTFNANLQRIQFRVDMESFFFTCGSKLAPFEVQKVIWNGEKLDCESFLFGIPF